MANWTRVDEDAVGFHDGNAGHVYTLPAGAPQVGDWDVIFLNSNTVLIGTPSGWTKSLDLIANFGAGNQGAYALTRKAVGGESGSVTIQTNGNFNAILSWSRWRGGDALDVATAAVIDASAGSVTPSVSTGTLDDPDELVLACAALQGAFPTQDPVWSAGYTPLTGVQYNGGPLDEVSSYVAYRTDGGTAAETPQADWTSTPAAPVADRYVMVLTFTPAAGQAVDVGQATETDTGLPAGRTKRRTLGQATETATAPAATRTKTRVLGIAVDTHTALPAARTKARALTQATTTDIGLPATTARSRTIGPAVDTSTALTATGAKRRTLGQASTTDIALPRASAAPLPGVLTISATGSTLTATAAAASTLTITRSP
jgi:hypothetical protein